MRVKPEEKWAINTGNPVGMNEFEECETKQ